MFASLLPRRARPDPFGRAPAREWSCQRVRARTTSHWITAATSRSRQWTRGDRRLRYPRRPEFRPRRSGHLHTVGNIFAIGDGKSDRASGERTSPTIFISTNQRIDQRAYRMDSLKPWQAEAILTRYRDPRIRCRSRDLDLRALHPRRDRTGDGGERWGCLVTAIAQTGSKTNEHYTPAGVTATPPTGIAAAHAARTAKSHALFARLVEVSKTTRAPKECKPGCWASPRRT